MDMGVEIRTKGVLARAIPVLDCRGLLCPMPILQVRLKTNAMKKDDELLILADDPTFSAEFLRFAYLADIVLLSKKEREGFQEYHVRLAS